MSELKTMIVVQQETEALLNALAPHFGEALQKSLAPEKLIRIVMSRVKGDKTMSECARQNPKSILMAVMEGAQRNLIPDGVRAALVPFKIKGKLTCQLIPMYQGLLNLAWNSGQVAGVACEVVRDGDPFDYNLGTGTVNHQKAETRGDMLMVYCVFKTVYGGTVTTVLTYTEVMAHKERSRASGSGPWVTDEEAMWRKTAIKVNCKKAPFSEDLRRAVQLDDQAEVGIGQDLPTIDIKALEIAGEHEEGPEPDGNGQDPALSEHAEGVYLQLCLNGHEWQPKGVAPEKCPECGCLADGYKGEPST